MSTSPAAETQSTRRDVLTKAGTTVVAAAGLSQVVDVAAGDTPSGNVELETTATVPTDTTIEITIFEDTTGDGTADRQESNNIPNGTTTTEYSLLQASTAQGHMLWIEVALSTSDDSVTPSLDTATITLPATTTATETATGPTATTEPVATDPQSPAEIWQNYRAFVAMVVIFFAGVGLWSRSLTLAAWAGYVAFLHIAFTTGTPLFENIAYATLVLVFLGMAFKLTRLEFEGEA